MDTAEDILQLRVIGVVDAPCNGESLSIHGIESIVPRCSATSSSMANNNTHENTRISPSAGAKRSP